jgi:hypothetical protein
MMAVNWKSFCDASDLTVEHSDVLISFGDDRSHRVRVSESDDEFLLRAFVVRQAVVASITDLPLQVWQRNRAVSLMGFRIDKRRRLVGEAWVPKAGLTGSEFQLYLRHLAVEADRFEYALTGRDSE